MKTHVERLTDAYEEARQQRADEGETNKFALLLTFEELRQALEHNITSTEFMLWKGRNSRIYDTHYSRSRDKDRALRRSDFRFAADLDAIQTGGA